MKGRFIILFLLLLPVSVHSTVIQWEIEFVEPNTLDIQETHVTGQGVFSYDTNTVFSVSLYGPPEWFDPVRDFKGDINTRLDIVQMQNLGVHWGMDSQRYGIGAFWWEDDIGVGVHNPGSLGYNGAESWFDSGWEFWKTNGPFQQHELIMSHGIITSTTASGKWSQDGRKGSWTAQRQLLPCSKIRSADCNNDSVINVQDVICIINIVLGK